ncbi:MAG: PilZ domain-containing protein [Clostridia bacterium]|nr:PilZ domain-containing protein [Clostridia bacterium]
MAFSRADVRLETDMKATALMFYDENGVVMPELKDVPITIFDLSATGMSVKCKRELKKGDSFYLELELGTKKVKLIPIIVRSELVAGEYIYGCRFDRADEAETAAIRQYIFDEQIKIRRRMKNGR